MINPTTKRIYLIAADLEPTRAAAVTRCVEQRDALIQRMRIVQALATNPEDAAGACREIAAAARTVLGALQS